jgi:hypothetical protein
MVTSTPDRTGGSPGVSGFHDHPLAAGMIPIALAEWEITGSDDFKEIDLR